MTINAKLYDLGFKVIEKCMASKFSESSFKDSLQEDQQPPRAAPRFQVFENTVRIDDQGMPFNSRINGVGMALCCEGFYLAGGAIPSLIAGEQPKDLDFFVKGAKYVNAVFGQKLRNYGLIVTEEDVPGVRGLKRLNLGLRHNYLRNEVKTDEQELQSRIDQYNSGLPRRSAYGEVRHLTRNALSINPNIQVILRFAGDPEAVIDTFDFDHAKCYATFEPGRIATSTVIRPEASKAQASKTLVYNRSYPTPIAAMARAFKFCGRGYSITPFTLVSLVAEIQKLDLSNKEVVLDNLRGLYDLPDRRMREIIKNSVDTNGVVDVNKMIQILGEL